MNVELICQPLRHRLVDEFPFFKAMPLDQRGMIHPTRFPAELQVENPKFPSL